MKRVRARRLRTLSAAVFAGVVTMAVLSPSSGATVAPTAFATLNGEGAWSAFEQIVPWQNELSGAKSFIDLNYSARGSFFGREDLITSLTTPENDPSHLDFAISGRGFTADQLARVKGGNSAFIAAPVQVTALATLVNPPLGGFNTLTTRCNPDLLDPADPSTWPPGITDPETQCQVTTKFTGPIRIASRNLAAMFLHYQGSEFPPVRAWNNPAELAALGLTSTDAVQQSIATFSAAAAPGFAGRSDPDETNYYLQQFVQTAAPDVWEGIKNQPPPKPWEPISERLQQVAGVTRDGAEQQVDQLGLGCGVDGNCSASTVGGIAPAPPSMVRSFHSTFPAKTIDVAEMKNANGDWVAPTAASISKAVDAGGAAPLYALTNKVPGAYPLVWVDNLYAPAHGLSVAKTESVATLIRYLATSGQEAEAANGEGRLSAPLVAESLAAANQVVTSNCVGADRMIVTSSDPGPLAPASAKAMQSIGNMLHCVATVPPTTTTTAAKTVTTVAAVPSTVGAQGNTDATTPIVGDSAGTPVDSGSTPPNTVVTVPDSTSSGSLIATKQLKSGLLIASQLPLPTPGGASSSDRLATFLLGAFLYLLLRKPVGRLGKRLAA